MGTIVNTATRPRPAAPDRPGSERSRSEEGARHSNLTVVLVAIALLTTLAGVSITIMRALTDSPAIGLETEARSESMSLWVSNVDFIAHDHSAHDHGEDGEDGETGQGAAATDQTDNILNGSGAGFTMPASMMPGTPEEGYQRVQVNLDFRNAGAARAVEPADFELVVEGRGLSFAPLRGGTFNNTVVGTSQMLSTIVTFDIPVTIDAADLRLEWHDGDNQIRFALADGEGHDHG